MTIKREAGGYLAECGCGWLRWTRNHSLAQRWAAEHETNCEEKR